MYYSTYGRKVACQKISTKSTTIDKRCLRCTEVFSSLTVNRYREHCTYLFR